MRQWCAHLCVALCDQVFFFWPTVNRRMLTLPIASVHIEPGKALGGPIQREKINRGNIAWLIRDTFTQHVLLAQHLGAAAAWINEHHAQTRAGHVTPRGLYESITTGAKSSAQSVSILHKCRYHVSRCPLGKAHIIFTKQRANNTHSATLISLIRPQ